MLNTLFASLLLAVNVNFTPPMSHEISLAGNFGEPRPNHFHGGIDFRTEGVEGKPIMAIGDGYVSRVTVGLYGFGNAVYVTHPEGYTSIYCHLQRFTPRLERLLKRWQYEHEQREADVRLSATDCPVAQGQLIAFSGNTGHSFGPHLHMEIHDTRSWNMLDPLEFLGSYVNDSVPPQIHGIMAYPHQGVFNGSQERSSLDEKNTAWGRVGFAVYADDYMQNSHNHYGIRLTQLLVDGREVFRADVNGIPGSCNRMVNSWGDYDYYYEHSRWYLKSFIEPANSLPILKADEQQGIIDFNEERDYHLEYVLADFFGNTTHKSFVVRGVPSPLTTYPSPLTTLRWNQTNIISRPGMQLVVPYGYVGVDTPLQLSTESGEGLSPVYTFSERSCPLFYAAELSIATRQEVRDPSKLCIVCHFGKDISLGGNYKDGWVTASVRDLGGTYELVYDDEPPVIESKNTDTELLRFNISDEVSGIKSYKGYVDGQFVLFKAQTQSLTTNAQGTTLIACRLSNTPVKRTGQQRRLKLVVTDNRDNQQIFETNIKY